MNCPKCGDYNPNGTIICGNCGCSINEEVKSDRDLSFQYEMDGNRLYFAKRYTEALEFYLKAAELGNKSTYQRLGDLYYSGEGTAVDYKEAAKWYHTAIDAHSVTGSAYENLATMYRYGMGVEQNIDRAIEFYRWAITLHKSCYEFYKPSSLSADIVMESAEALGRIYETAPEGVKSNNMALEYYEKAAEMNSESATVYEKLGLSYGKGVGRPINYEKAFKFCKNAIEYGCENGEVYFIAAELYQNGKGGEENEFFAKRYYQNAVNLGYEPAEKALEALLQKMQKERAELQAGLAWAQEIAARSEKPFNDKDEWRRRQTRTCPRCGKNSGHPLNELGKKASIGFWGFASRKWGKSYECDCCGYMW